MSEHHSFDIRLAAQYSPEVAILIQHFQFWIRMNRYRNKNIKDGKCWTYQTRKEIQAHFPYWNYDHVKYLCEKLVDLGILVTANYNKNPIDKTLWYAFVDEKAFGVDEESSNNLYEGQKCPSKGKSAFGEGKSAQPIPDTKKKMLKEDKKEMGSQPSADAQAISEKFLSRIKSIKPDFLAKGYDKWAQEIDKMIRIDKRDPRRISELIDCLEFKDVTYVQSAKKLREQFDSLEMKNTLKLQKLTIEGNRIFFLKHKEQLKTEFKYISFNDREIIDVVNNKKVSFSLPYREFAEAVAELIGGTVNE